MDKKAQAVTDVSPTIDRPVIALVLGGGGAKGFAHIGVIETLEAAGIQPDWVVGTSIGSVIGSLYASGKTGEQLKQIALTTPDSALTDLTLSHQGIIEGNKLRAFINNQVGGKPIERFPIHFAAVVTRKDTLKKTVFTQGEAGLIVQASSSVPNIFIAPRIASAKNPIGYKYIDGGVVSIVPVDAAKQLGADVIIAVDLQADKTALDSNETHLLSTILSGNRRSRRTQGNIWTLIEQGYSGYVNVESRALDMNNTRAPAQQKSQGVKQAEIARADVLIQPNVVNISALDTSQKQIAITAGKLATEQSLPAIQAAIQRAEANYQ